MSITEPAGAWNAPLHGSLRDLPSGVVSVTTAAAPGLASHQSERRRRHSLHAERAHGIGSLEHAPRADGSTAAAKLSRTTRIRVHCIALDTKRECHLQNLDRRIHGVRDAAGDRVDAVLVRARAKATLDCLVGNIARSRAGVDATERNDCGRTLTAGHDAIRPDRGKRAHHHVGNAVRHLMIGVNDGSGKRRVDHRGFRCLDRNRRASNRSSVESGCRGPPPFSDRSRRPMQSPIAVRSSGL